MRTLLLLLVVVIFVVLAPMWVLSRKMPKGSLWKELAKDPGNFLMALVGLAFAIIFGWLGYETSQQTLQMELGNELYSNERWWYDACADNPHLYGWLASPGSHPDEDVPPEEYVKQCLEAVSPGIGVYPANVVELHSYMWAGAKFNEPGEPGEHKARIRRAYDLLDVVFYHLERVHSYTDQAFKPMDQEEADTWLGLLENIGPNPLLLCSIRDAHEYGYIKKDFAQWVQNTMRAHKHAYVVKYFYPQLLEDAWVKDLEKDHSAKKFFNPPENPKWRDNIEAKMKTFASERLAKGQPSAGQTDGLPPPASAPRAATPPAPAPVLPPVPRTDSGAPSPLPGSSPGTPPKE